MTPTRYAVAAAEPARALPRRGARGRGFLEDRRLTHSASAIAASTIRVQVSRVAGLGHQMVGLAHGVQDRHRLVHMLLPGEVDLVRRRTGRCRPHCC